MTKLKGIYVLLNTMIEKRAGTDDHVYVGITGSQGGREFPLDVRRHDDFEPGVCQYRLGSVPDYPDALVPWEAAPGESNAPDCFDIDIDGVQTVYLRKQGDYSHHGDDAWKLAHADVFLYDEEGNAARQFGIDAENGVWLSNEHGLQVWLRQY